MVYLSFVLLAQMTNEIRKRKLHVQQFFVLQFKSIQLNCLILGVIKVPNFQQLPRSNTCNFIYIYFIMDEVFNCSGRISFLRKSPSKSIINKYLIALKVFVGLICVGLNRLCNYMKVILGCC